MDAAKIAQKSPFATEVTAGRQYWWCACGRSAKQPFCDGSHKTTSLQPHRFLTRSIPSAKARSGP